jgi:molecular chaperone IbpA
MVTTQALANVFDHFDRNLLTPYAVGFDRVFDRLQDYTQHQIQSTGFPPYNIRKEGDYNFTSELALAGLTKGDVGVGGGDGVLTVRTKAKKEEAEGAELLHRGISFRQFNRKWTLADDIVVKDAKMENGMLLIELERVIPEEKKPRLLTIK